MKSQIFLIVFLSIISLNAQSVLILGAGTSVTIGTGADLCAGSIEGSGTFCGNPTGIESDDYNNLPTEFALGQNYPNPFNPTTKISWQLPVGSHQTLKVYDILGNEVVTLVNEYREAGRYEVEFNASGMASGIFMYKLQAGSFIETKKMTIIK